MKQHFKVSLGDECFTAEAGKLLLDAALLNGVDLPHDCRAGRCGACTVQVRHGLTFGGETGEPNCIRACRAHVFSDLELDMCSTTSPVRLRGVIAELQQVGDRVFAVGIALHSPMKLQHGQYCNVRFRGFPARSFSPTANLETGSFDGLMRFHIKQVRGGRVTPHIGGRIAAGHKVMVEGPYGAAYHRPSQTGRLVLVSGGTGFAPVWAVFCAAVAENPTRGITLVCGVHEMTDFYMESALRVASQFQSVQSISTFEHLPDGKTGSLLMGSPADHLPHITHEDIVYAAGSPKMVERIALKAAGVGAIFFADPFEADTSPDRATLGVDALKRLIACFPSLFERAA
jgi:NAD(P)H-flavin reductase